MGRNSGFIALHATLGSRDVDCVLIPEIDFAVDGPDGLMAFLEERLLENGHVVSQSVHQVINSSVRPSVRSLVTLHYTSRQHTHNFTHSRIRRCIR